MKKDNMLNESTIRRFMKLATIDGLSDKFVAENLAEANEEELEERGGPKPPMKRDDEKEMREGDDDVEEGMHPDKRDDEKEMREGDKDDDEMREAAHEDDEDVKEGKHKDDDEMRESEEELAFEEEMDMAAAEPAAEAGGMVSVDQLMSALERALEDVLGQEVEVSQDDEDEVKMDAEEPADLGLDMADAGEEADEEDDLEETTIQPDVVEEVFARVIQRLTQETKSNKE